MSKLVLSCFYFVSFFPLWISILFIDIMSIIKNTDYLWTEKISIFVILLGSVISLLILLVVFNPSSRKNSMKYKLKEAKDEKTMASDYLLSYILPLLAFDFTKWEQLVLFLIFFIIFWFLCIYHNYFSINIFLVILNYKIYNCEIESDDGIIYKSKVISHRVLNACTGDNIYLNSLNNDIKMDIDK